MIFKNMLYRTHYCGNLNHNHVNQIVVLSGWLARKRLHGGLLFIDIRDYSGIAQCMIEEKNETLFYQCQNISYESVLKVQGLVIKRPDGKENNLLNSGDIEIIIKEISVISRSKELPFMISQTKDQIPEESRLEYRFLDLRRPEMRNMLQLRANVIKELRIMMEEQGFIEVHTPLLTSSSPEGARDFVVPSRLHKGKFYALPQSPQLFKQLLMVGGIEKYYQVAPCFRDEAGRSDRAVGAFYQLDAEFAFADQEMIFETFEPIFKRIFDSFGKHNISKTDKMPKISFKESMESYGTDKPDLRNPLRFINFKKEMNKLIQTSDKLKNIFGHADGYMGLMSVPNLSIQSRKFFDELKKEAATKGALDVGYIFFDKSNLAKGSMAKLFDLEGQNTIRGLLANYHDGAILVSHPSKKQFYQIISTVRTWVAKRLNIIEKNVYKFCWIVDFPMYEQNDDGCWDFSHNPFSMPQDIDGLTTDNITNIVGYQYDFVCNGYELCSGAVRNYDPDIMYKVFSLIGLGKEYVDTHFSCMIRAFSYGPPPHAGCALGIERMLMLLAPEVVNIREVIPFPLTQGGLDLIAHAPTEISEAHIKELGLDFTKKLDKK